MSKIAEINPTRSYCIIMSRDAGTTSFFEAYGKKKNFRVLTATDAQSLKQFLKSVRHLMAVIIDHDHLDASAIDESSKFLAAEEIEFMNLRRKNSEITWGQHKESIPQLTNESFETVLNKYISTLIPAELVKVWGQSLDYIHPILFPNSAAIKFHQGHAGLKDSDIIVSCQIQGKGFLSQVVIGVNLKKFVEVNKTIDPSDKVSIVDNIREFANQILGATGFNLGKAQLPGRIGLPVVIDRTGDTQMQLRSTFYIPTISFSDDQGVYALEFGLLITQDGPKVTKLGKAMSENAAAESTDEVEFF